MLDGRFQQPRFETTDTKTVRNVAAMFASLIDAEPRPYERPEGVLEFFAGTARLARIEICGAFLTVTDCECPGCFRLEIDVCRQLNGWLRSIPRAAR